MKVLLFYVLQLLLAVATYRFGFRRGRSQGRRDGYIHGHERALAASSRMIEDGVFQLAERVIADGGGHDSPTLRRFLGAFTRGEHLR